MCIKKEVIKKLQKGRVTYIHNHKSYALIRFYTKLDSDIYLTFQATFNENARTDA